MKYQAERELVIKYAVEMEDRDLTVGTSGNVSMRVDDGAIITPSTIPYKEIRPEDCCLLDLEGGVLEGEKIPSVEHKVHLECYKARPDVNAVIHAHPTEIAKSAVDTMGETANAVFLASHGMVCVGRDLAGAMHVARQVERGAQIYLWTKMLGGPVDLPEDSKNLFAQVFAFYRTR